VPLVGDFVHIFTYLILHAFLYALYLRNVHYALDQGQATFLGRGPDKRSGSSRRAGA